MCTRPASRDTGGNPANLLESGHAHWTSLRNSKATGTEEHFLAHVVSVHHRARSQAGLIDKPLICPCDWTTHCGCYGQSEWPFGVTIMQFELLTLVIGVFFVLAYGFWMVTHHR
jgi:hypothetical protein